MNQDTVNIERCTLCGLPVHYFESAALDDSAQVCPFCRSFDMLQFELDDAMAEVRQILAEISS